MFYYYGTGTTIYLNRELTTLSAYTFKFKNKNEFNIEYSESLTPITTNERYSSFTINLNLKKGDYKFYVYEGTTLIYNDICVVKNIVDGKVEVDDTEDYKVVIPE